MIKTPIHTRNEEAQNILEPSPKRCEETCTSQVSISIKFSYCPWFAVLERFVLPRSSKNLRKKIRLKQLCGLVNFQNFSSKEAI